MSKVLSQVDLIREAFYYQSRFEGSTMVFKIDYPVTQDPCFPGLVKDLALLAQTGFKVVIVPGAREWIDTVLQQHAIASFFREGPDAQEFGVPFRVTSAQAIPFVEMAVYNVATNFMTLLSGSRVDALIGNFVRARGLGVIDGVDMEHTGTVDKINADSIIRILNLGMVPILPCIGWSPSGKPYNVPSDEVALAVSAELGAIKLFIITVHGGLQAGSFTSAAAPTFPERPETMVTDIPARFTLQEAETLIRANDVKDLRKPNFPELRLALRACRAGVDRVHIIDGRKDGAVLKELFSNLGNGIMVYTDEYESIRPFRIEDLSDLRRLIEPLVQKGFLVRRSAEQIQEKKDDYIVFEIDGSIHACGALHDWGEAQGEIAAIATDPLYKDMGLGRKIVGYLIEKARKDRMSRVFILTTRSQDWFEALGFVEAPVESLPAQKLKKYDYNRKSKVFALEL